MRTGLASLGSDDHSMSHGSDAGENYWPGYVDALTSMVQVLAFVMIMLAMAVGPAASRQPESAASR